MARLSRFLLLIAALFALSVRLLVPAGFMPGNSGGHLVLDICTGHGALKADIGGKPSGKSDSNGLASGCAVSFSNILKYNDNIPFIGLVVFAILLLFAKQRFAVSFVRLTPRLRPPLRAPPAV